MFWGSSILHEVVQVIYEPFLSCDAAAPPPRPDPASDRADPKVTTTSPDSLAAPATANALTPEHTATDARRVIGFGQATGERNVRPRDGRDADASRDG